MTFTDLCNEIKKKKMIDRIISVLGVIAIFGGIIAFFCFGVWDEHTQAIHKRNEDLMLENICIAQETAEAKDKEIASIIQEKDEKTANLITIMFNEYLKGASWAKTAE